MATALEAALSFSRPTTDMARVDEMTGVEL